MHTETNTTRQKAERFEARMTADVKRLCQRAAAMEGRSLTDFVVNSASEAARKIISTNEMLELSYQNKIAFVEALLKPASVPNKRLREAAKRYEKMTTGL